MQFHTFMNTNKYDMVVFEQAYGTPEIIIRSMKLQSKTACALDKKYTSTGFNHSQECVCDSSVGIMNCAQSNTQMIYTRIQQALLTALRQNNRASLSACLNTMSRRACKTLLNEFIPIHENLFLKQKKNHVTLVLSLFTYALLFCTTHIVELCFQHGGRLSVPYPSEMLGWDNKHTISAGEGALECYNRILKNMLASAVSRKTKHERQRRHRTSRRLTRSAYAGYLPKERFVGQLPTNLKFLNSLTLVGIEQRCLNALLRDI